MNETFHKLFIEKLHILYYIEEELIKRVPRRIEHARDSELKDALESHLEETKKQLERVGELLESFGEEPNGIPFPPLDVLLEESEPSLEIEDLSLRDAIIIASVQAIEHLEIALYGTASSWAKAMDHARAHELLSETLEEEKSGDERLSELAEDSINEKAAGTEKSE